MSLSKMFKLNSFSLPILLVSAMTLHSFIIHANESSQSLSTEQKRQVKQASQNQNHLRLLNYDKQYNDLQEIRNEFSHIQDKVNSKWSKFKSWQENTAWLDETAKLSMSGEIFSGGWLSPKVSRQVVPDVANGWLAIDTITVGPNLLMMGATLAGNIFLNSVFPYVQGGPIKERTYLNVRNFDTYREALEAPTFDLTNLPLTANDFTSLRPTEQFSTVSSGGYFVRVGGGIANLIGLELPAHLNIGPKAKFTFEGALKLSVAKAENQKVLISVETIDEQSKGFGIGFGVFFEDLLDIPVTVGINSSYGYFPFLYNVKQTKKKVHAVMYEVDLAEADGQRAYQAFLKRDFAYLEEMADRNPRAVQVDLIKDGTIHSKEKNSMLNLVFWRSGYRNLFVEGKFNATDRAGKQFSYHELEAQQIFNTKAFGNKEDLSLKFSALVPSSNHPQFEMQKQFGGFVLDTHFYYSDTRTKGKELQEIADFLARLGPQLKIPLIIENNQNYKHVQIDVKIRILAPDMARFLWAGKAEIFEASAYALGLNDIGEWASKSAREHYLSTGNQDKRQAKIRKYNHAARLINFLAQVRKSPSLVSKANMIMQRLKDPQHGSMLQRTILEFVGAQKSIVRGAIRGSL